jgi:hypothetical protein
MIKLAKVYLWSEKYLPKLLPTSASPILMSPLTLSENLIHCFTFVGPDGCLKQGMRNGGKLYVYVTAFPTAYENQAYALAYGLSEYEQQVVITVSDSGYNVWKELRSLHQPTQSENSSMLSV